MGRQAIGSLSEAALAIDLHQKHGGKSKSRPINSAIELVIKKNGIQLRKNGSTQTSAALAARKDVIKQCKKDGKKAGAFIECFMAGTKGAATPSTLARIKRANDNAAMKG